MYLLIVIILSYLIGAIPVGFIIGKMHGVDIRTVGSKNPGATNVRRALGNKAGLLTFLFDALKGIVAISIIAPIAIKTEASIAFSWVQVIAGLIVICGHNWTVFLNFKGGKGVATGAGVLVALDPLSFFICLGVFSLVLYLFKMVSLGSIIAVICLPTMFMIQQKHSAYIFLGVAAVILVVFRHKDNIKSIINGTENKIGDKSDR